MRLKAHFDTGNPTNEKQNHTIVNVTILGLQQGKTTGMHRYEKVDGIGNRWLQ